MKCNFCDQEKEEKHYSPSNFLRKIRKCKSCEKKYRKKRRKNINWVIGSIFHHQHHTKIPTTVEYTFEEFSDWLMNKTDFLSRYQNWEVHEFEKSRIPAVLRRDASKPFTFDNLMVTDSKKARERIAVMRSRPVVQLGDDNNEIALFPNARVAANLLGIGWYGNIHRVCQGIGHTVGGYGWKYAQHGNKVFLQGKNNVEVSKKDGSR